MNALPFCVSLLFAFASIHIVLLFQSGSSAYFLSGWQSQGLTDLLRNEAIFFGVALASVLASLAVRRAIGVKKSMLAYVIGAVMISSFIALIYGAWATRIASV